MNNSPSKVHTGLLHVRIRTMVWRKIELRRERALRAAYGPVLHSGARSTYDSARVASSPRTGRVDFVIHIRSSSGIISKAAW